MDDWGYSLTFEGERINNLFDIIRAEYQQYITWGGRSVVHIIARTLLWFGEPWNNVLNALAYVALTLLIYVISNNSGKINIPLFFLINILIWFTLPSFSQNLLWITGSANYLWGCLLIYIFIFLYMPYLKKPIKKDSIIRSVVFGVFGVIVGWTNENMGIAALFFVISLLLYLKYNKISIPRWMIFGLVGVTLGYAMMMLSPGNAYRGKSEFLAIHNMQEVPLSFYFYRFITICKFSLTYLLFPALVYIFMLMLYLWKGIKEKKKKILFLSLLFFCSSAIATIVMSGSPSFPERAWFGIIILMIILMITSIVILYANIDFSDLRLKIANYLIFTVIFIVYLISCAESYSELLRFEQVCLKRDRYIDEEKQKGVKNIVVRDTLFQQKDSPLVVLDLIDWLIVDGSFGGRYASYKGVADIEIQEVK